MLESNLSPAVRHKILTQPDITFRTFSMSGTFQGVRL